MTCPTCGRDGCPHAGAPVSPAGELARLREENDRLKLAFAGQLDPFFTESLRENLRAELIKVMAARIETLELQRGI